MALNIQKYDRQKKARPKKGQAHKPTGYYLYQPDYIIHLGNE